MPKPQQHRIDRKTIIPFDVRLIMTTTTVQRTLLFAIATSCVMAKEPIRPGASLSA